MTTTIQAKSEEHLSKPCKKHHTNIKSSKRKKETQSTDIKDADATEVEALATGAEAHAAEPTQSFYIGEHVDEGSPINSKLEERGGDVHTKVV